MPWYRLACKPAVLVDLAALDKELAQRLLDKTKWLASNVGNLRHEPIAPDLPGLAKYAVGDWRIFYWLTAPTIFSTCTASSIERHWHDDASGAD